MRKIIVGLFMSLDGVVEGPGGADSFEKAGWTEPYWDDSIGQLIGENAMQSDAMLLGRVTYQGFASFFANGPADNPSVAMMNNFNKYVVSNTLTSADWQNSTLIKGANVYEEVARLKEQDGKNITISGSIELVQSLLEHDLVDELQLLLYPVILGTGKKLFPDGLDKKFKLVSAKPFTSSVVLLDYELDRGA